MADYVFRKGRWRGHSTNDTKPDPVGKYLQRLEETDTGIVYFSDGVEWVRSGTVGTSQIANLAVTTAKLASPLTGINAKIPDNEFTWAKINKTGATVVVKETLNYAFQGTAVRVSSMIMGTNHSTNGQGTSGHVLGIPTVVKRVRIIPVANAKTGNTVIKLWKDSTELATWTISAGSTTEIDSGAISHAITAAEKLDLTCDTSAGGAGLSITIGFLVDIEKTVNLS